jgi:23S rRNA pseudouridine1911/1915/1917 synthase
MLSILFEDEHFIIVNKPTGQPVQPDKTGDPSLLEEIKTFLKKKDKNYDANDLEMAHRIDRPASGIVIFGKTKKAVRQINRMFRIREIEKKYWVITENCPNPEAATLTHYLRFDGKKNKASASEKPSENAQQAVLDYQLIGKSVRYFFLEINLHTGRHHQIRCQLAAIGCPIKGDLKYGAKRSNPNGGIHLHARQASFIHPFTGDTVTVTAPPTKEDTMWQVFVAAHSAN